MSRLQFQGVHRFAAGFQLEVAFEAGDKITALFGPSGSGKSTTLAIISGLIRPQKGFVRLGDHVLLDTEKNVFIPPERRRLGAVFQDDLLFPHRTVGANLAYGQSRRPARNIDFNRVVEILELGDLLDRYPNTLSGGQRQRTSLGRAILRGPELLLMDEPLTSLDDSLKERILTYLERAVAEWRIPTIFVSHDQGDVRRLADRVVVLEEGRVIEAGPTQESLDRAVTSTMRSHPGPVNLLRVDSVQRIEGHCEGRLGEQRLHLPHDIPTDGASAHVRFLAADVTLSRKDVVGLSMRNHLIGRVREVVALPESDRAFVAVDVGQFLWAEVTMSAVRELDLHPGAEVVCLIKTSAVRPFR